LLNIGKTASGKSTDGSSMQAHRLQSGADVCVAGSEADKTNFYFSSQMLENGIPVTLSGSGSVGCNINPRYRHECLCGGIWNAGVTPLLYRNTGKMSRNRSFRSV
jgi:hypothetical protein